MVCVDFILNQTRIILCKVHLENRFISNSTKSHFLKMATLCPLYLAMFLKIREIIQDLLHDFSNTHVMWRFFQYPLWKRFPQINKRHYHCFLDFNWHTFNQRGNPIQAMVAFSNMHSSRLAPSQHTVCRNAFVLSNCQYCLILSNRLLLSRIETNL
jgi:hypothetical protein